MVKTEGTNTGSCLLYGAALFFGLPFAYEKGGAVGAVVAFLAINVFWKVFLPTDE